VLSPDRSINLLRLVRRNLLELADLFPDRQALYSQLMSVDQRLGETLREESRPAEMRALYEASLRDTEEAIRQFPRAAFPRDWQFNLLHRLGELAEAEGRMDDLVALHERAVAGSEERFRESPGAESLAGLVMRRRNLARALAVRGRPDEAQDLLLANLRALEDAPADWLNEGIVAARALNPMVFRHLGLDPPPRPHVDGPLASIAGLASVEADRLPADAWARSAARALRFDDPGRPAAYRESRAAHWFASWIHTIACDQRNGGHLDRAGQNADRLVAFARLLVERNPNDPAAYLVLADSYEQVGKNAWRVPDRAAIRRTLEQAIDANRRAVDLTPYDEVAHHQLERRRRKLDDFLHPH
jgi:tetratricopeptide (TPR) repeat protein